MEMFAFIRYINLVYFIYYISNTSIPLRFCSADGECNLYSQATALHWQQEMLLEDEVVE